MVRVRDAEQDKDKTKADMWRRASESYLENKDAWLVQAYMDDPKSFMAYRGRNEHSKWKNGQRFPVWTLHDYGRKVEKRFHFLEDVLEKLQGVSIDERPKPRCH